MTAVNDFVDTILQRFPPYRWDDAQEQSWMDDAKRELSVFSDIVVERARREIVRTRKKPAIPTIAELIDACLDARRWIEREEGKAQLPLEPSPRDHGWTEDRLKHIASIMRTPLGQEAIREGWDGAMREHIRKTLSAPVGPQIAACKKIAKEVDEIYASIVRGEFTDKHGVLHKYNQDQRRVLQRWGADVLTRRGKQA